MWGYYGKDIGRRVHIAFAIRKQVSLGIGISSEYGTWIDGWLNVLCFDLSFTVKVK